MRKPYLLYVGALEPRKNLFTLLEAFERLIVAERTEFRLLLAGGGSHQYVEPLRTRIGAHTQCTRRIH